MLVWRVGARFLAGGHSVVNMPPVVGRDRCGIDAETSIASIARSTRSTCRQPSSLSRMSPPGRTKGSVWNGSSAAHRAHDVDARDDRAVLSPAAQRTKAKMLFGAKPTILRRRSRICS